MAAILKSESAIKTTKSRVIKTNGVINVMCKSFQTIFTSAIEWKESVYIINGLISVLSSLVNNNSSRK